MKKSNARENQGKERPVGRYRAARTSFRLPRPRSMVAVAVVLAILAMLFQACDDEPAGTSITTSLRTETTTAHTAMATTGTTATRAVPGSIDGASAVRIDLPDAMERAGWTLVKILPDGRLVLNSGSRLSIFDPSDDTETIIREAEFGIQAAANANYVVFGIGGDEVPAVFVHHIAANYTEMVLQDPAGYLDLEVTRTNGVLASRIRYTGAEAVLDAWVRYDVASHTVTTIPSGERSYAKYLFRARYPDKNASWTYEIGQLWHEAWVDGTEELFYSEVVRHGRDDYEMRIHRSTASGDGPVLYEQSTGPIPEIRLSGNLLVVEDTTAIRMDTGHVLDLPETDYPHGAAFVGIRQDRILIAALDSVGRPADLYQFSLNP